MEKLDCYWAYEGEKKVGNDYFPEIYCHFDEVKPCAQHEYCRRYIQRDKLDDYIKHLLEELEYYYKLP